MQSETVEWEIVDCDVYTTDTLSINELLEFMDKVPSRVFMQVELTVSGNGTSGTVYASDTLLQLVDS